jgi:hypothetical protein
MKHFYAAWTSPDFSREVGVKFKYTWTSKGLLVQNYAFTDKYLIREGETREIPGLFGGSGIFVTVSGGRAVVRYRPDGEKKCYYVGTLWRKVTPFKGVFV